MTTQDRKYPHLGANFLKGQRRRGESNLIQRTREMQPEKLAEFKQAIACRDIPIKASPAHAGKPGRNSRSAASN
jgi:hypothetical protein